MTINLSEMKSRFRDLLVRHASMHPEQADALLPTKDVAGKTYEALVLAWLVKMLVTKEGLTVTFIKGHKFDQGTVALKYSHGPLNRDYPHFRVANAHGDILGEIWTDIEFLTLSFQDRRRSSLPAQNTPRNGDFHELDITLVKEGVSSNSRPDCSQIIIAIECKYCKFDKSMLRSVLGIRRELSILSGHQKATGLKQWPQKTVNADPPSCIVVCSKDPDVDLYQTVGNSFAIFFNEVNPSSLSN